MTSDQAASAIPFADEERSARAESQKSVPRTKNRDLFNEDPWEAERKRIRHCAGYGRRPGGAIEISASRWSPVINRIVSDPPGQPPANRYLDRSKAVPHANSRRRGRRS